MMRVGNLGRCLPPDPRQTLIAGVLGFGNGRLLAALQPLRRACLRRACLPHQRCPLTLTRSLVQNQGTKFDLTGAPPDRSRRRLPCDRSRRLRLLQTMSSETALVPAPPSATRSFWRGSGGRHLPRFPRRGRRGREERGGRGTREKVARPQGSLVVAPPPASVHNGRKAVRTRGRQLYNERGA